MIKKTHTEEKKGFTITFFNRPSETDKKTLHDGTNNADSIYPPQTAAAAAKHIFYAFRLEGSPLTGNKRLIIISVTSLTNNGTHKKKCSRNLIKISMSAAAIDQDFGPIIHCF